MSPMTLDLSSALLCWCTCMQVLDPANRITSAVRENLPLKARFFVAGSIWDMESNSEEIVRAMRETFDQAGGKQPADLHLRFHVDFAINDQPRWSTPHFRALDHLYYATYGPCDSMLVDQIGRRVIGSFSPAAAADLRHWKQIVLPVLLGIVSASIGVTPVHCACVVKSGSGLLLGGESGAGKSTTALELSRNGFSLLSDDCTYLSRSATGVRAWGLPTPVKLLPDAVSYFPELASLEPVLSLNGEWALNVDPTEISSVERCLSCAPRWLVFLERKVESRPVARQLSSPEAASRLLADLETLPPCNFDQYEYQLETVDRLVDRECWVVQHGLRPEPLAELLTVLCENSSEKIANSSCQSI
jgi:HPr Serine kinase C-terminal domain